MCISKNNSLRIKASDGMNSVKMVGRLVQSCRKDEWKVCEDDALAKSTQLTKKAFLMLQSVYDKFKVSVSYQ